MSDSELAQKLCSILEATEADLGRMPFFVRPMAKKGFARRTGLDHAGWLRLARTLCSECDAGKALPEIGASMPALVGQLESLADNYATAPERAAKGMGKIPGVLERVTRESKERETAVREILARLRA